MQCFYDIQQVKEGKNILIYNDYNRRQDRQNRNKIIWKLNYYLLARKYKNILHLCKDFEITQLVLTTYSLRS